MHVTQSVACVSTVEATLHVSIPIVKCSTPDEHPSSVLAIHFPFLQPSTHSHPDSLAASPGITLTLWRSNQQLHPAALFLKKHTTPKTEMS